MENGTKRASSLRPPQELAAPNAGKSFSNVFHRTEMVHDTAAGLLCKRPDASDRGWQKEKSPSGC